MREKNWRFIGTGTLLITLSIAFFIGMMGMATQSSDPVGLMRTVGEVVGVLTGLSLAMIGVGLVGRRVWSAVGSDAHNGRGSLIEAPKRARLSGR